MKVNMVSKAFVFISGALDKLNTCGLWGIIIKDISLQKGGINAIGDRNYNCRNIDMKLKF